MLYGIGDVHGCFSKLESLWQKIHPSFADTIVFLGDYIDRGPNSKKVMDFIMDRQAEGHDIILLMGNHEHMCIAATERNSILNMKSEEVQGMWLNNGGYQTMKNFNLLPPPKKYIQFMKSCRLYYETDKYIFVHAGLRPYPQFNDPLIQIQEDMLWIREPFINTMYDFGKKIVFGHTPTSYINSDRSIKPYRDEFKIGIDTGAFLKAGKLTCVRLPDEEFISM